jgi:hypothetical protein
MGWLERERNIVSHQTAAVPGVYLGILSPARARYFLSAHLGISASQVALGSTFQEEFPWCFV